MSGQLKTLQVYQETILYNANLNGSSPGGIIDLSGVSLLSVIGVGTPGGTVTFTGGRAPVASSTSFQNITFTAVNKGPLGNQITIQFVQSALIKPGTEFVTVMPYTFSGDQTILVQISNFSTAAQVAASVNGSPASQYVTASSSSGVFCTPASQSLTSAMSGVDTSSSTIAVNSAPNFDGLVMSTGMALTLAGGSPPGGLSNGSVYYLINYAPGLVQLAASYSDAINDNPITLTTTGANSSFTLGASAFVSGAIGLIVSNDGVIWRGYGSLVSITAAKSYYYSLSEQNVNAQFAAVAVSAAAVNGLSVTHSICLKGYN